MISGEEKISNKEKALQFLSNYENLLKCTPGISKINGREFYATVKIGPISVEVQGIIVEHKVDGNKVLDKIEVKGPGIVVTIDTKVIVEDHKLVWEAEYSLSGSLAKALGNTVTKEAKELTKQIISCSVSAINSGNNS